jgi:hypothetical protein
MPNAQICDFREDFITDGYIEKSVKLGEILVSPVCAKYEVDGVSGSKVFWLVMLKTRKNFDFAGHVYDFVSNQVLHPDLIKSHQTQRQ